jgi:hypothetical protein
VNACLIVTNSAVHPLLWFISGRFLTGLLEPGLPRHPKGIAYRCFLPDLTGFTSLRCEGPNSIVPPDQDRVTETHPERGDSTPLKRIAGTGHR